jgi:hypothetical protein
MSRKATKKMKTTTEKNSATFTHLSNTIFYSQILFFQYYFGLQKKTSLNLLITVENKSSSIKSLLYTIGLALIAIPVLF